MYLKFWLKTGLYRFVPGGYGYYRRLHKLRDSNYVWTRDRHSVRDKHNKQGGWKEKNEGNLQYRDYENYDEYLDHQVLIFLELKHNIYTHYYLQNNIFGYPFQIQILKL